MKQTVHRSWARAIFIATALIMAGTTSASNGVIEINQACAEHTGCSSGDGAGFPVDLGGSGTARSYILTSDLVPTNSGSAMFINGDNVTLDMNGFRILCSPSSTFGIRFDSPKKNLRVSNGKIVGCNNGIGHGLTKGGDGARIDRVTVELVNIPATVSNGIVVGDNSMVESSTVTVTGGPGAATGIQVGAGSIVRNNIVYGVPIGILGGGACLFSGNIVRNSDRGMVGAGSTFINNTVIANFQIGILAVEGSNVISNTVRENGTGLSLSFDTAYRGNTITDSTTITVTPDTGVGAAQNRGGNTCLGPDVVITTCRIF